MGFSLCSRKAVRSLHSPSLSCAIWRNSVQTNSFSVSRPEATHPLELAASNRSRSLDHEKPGTTVTVRGYLTRYKRIKKDLHLWILRSRDYLRAVPIIADKLDDARIRQIAKSDTPVVVTGTREICMVKDSKSATEIHAKDILPLNAITPGNGWAGFDHEYPQSQRYLQLRYSSHLKDPSKYGPRSISYVDGLSLEQHNLANITKSRHRSCSSPRLRVLENSLSPRGGKGLLMLCPKARSNSSRLSWPVVSMPTFSLQDAFEMRICELIDSLNLPR